MKERPILFSAPMVRAILDGRKTVTRRVVKPQPQPNGGAGLHPVAPYQNPYGQWAWVLSATGMGSGGDLFSCPYGRPGDRLWVRETFSGPRCEEEFPPRSWYEADNIWYWADGNPDAGDWTRPRPSIHMPRWASRILLEITAVRVERLNEISEADSLAEGIQHPDCDDAGNLPACPQCNGTGLYTAFNPGTGGALPDTDCLICDTPVKRYRLLWESINGAGSWDVNPWVWVVEFKRVTP